ncbi:hypothetical protein CA13_64340 [Planctomycetes bacterium CA13]|uniref:Planctomycete cytochrome C n=1 Tax=Novipirellula herctigrandis TaxID=2527986 RepID=A0A5C5ZEI7_9BACT|nr:hypothetical protein CA13_64340 [Planctomycetes bacterium CA13]
MTNPSSFFALVFAVCFAATTQADEPTSAFLQNHCIRCHGNAKQKADRRFDTLPMQIKELDDLERYQEIVDQLNLQSMPPEGEPQPTAEERAKAIADLTRQIASARTELASGGRHTVMRRLNRFEYQQTIGDLLSLNVQAWNPAADFPPDVKVQGFDNNGRELVTSGMLLDHYLGAAEKAVTRATQFGPRPESKQYAQQTPYYFDGKNKANLPKLFQVDRFRFIPDTPYTDMYGRHYRGGHIGFRPLYGGVAHSGMYTIRVKAAAIDRDHPYGNALDDFRNGDPLVLEVATVDREGSVESTGSITTERSEGLAELTSEEPAWFEWTIHIDQGFEPEVRFRNGTTATKRLVRIISSKASEHPEIAPFANMKGGMEKSHGLLKVYRGPKLRIFDIRVEGPHIDQWPPAGHTLMYGDLQSDDLNRSTITERLRAFAAGAFRRPLNSGELKPIERMVMGKLDGGMEPLAALQLGFQTILCSPSFIYMQEGEGTLDGYNLASRLSYFLWSSQPDVVLLQHAKAERLSDANVLAAEVDRMLKDPRSERFVNQFVRRWLDWDNIGEMPVSGEFRVYYRDNLETAMAGETTTLFRHILDQNLPPKRFLDADYTFVNRELAAHYGLPAIEGNQLRQVSTEGTVRGGLMTHGSFLTASANGVDTSPVVRGIYALEKVMGYTPPPPPDDVPEIEPDIRGALTVREELAKHRSIATCAECHRKIDPLGFALENFDPIGAWRTEYGKKLPVDASGQLPSGKKFDDIRQLRTLLIERHESFTRSLTEKLMTYALGRELEIGDRPSVDEILAELNNKEGGLRDLIRLVVLSKPFLNN